MATAHKQCSVPGCVGPADALRSGFAYCAPHRDELNLVRRLLTRLHRPAPRRAPAVARVHRDPRSHARG